MYLFSGLLIYLKWVTNSVFQFSVFFPHYKNNGVFSVVLTPFQWVTTYIRCLLFVFFFPFFHFLFFFPAARTNPAKVVDIKQSPLDATAIGNSFLHKH